MNEVVIVQHTRRWGSWGRITLPPRVSFELHHESGIGSRRPRALAPASRLKLLQHRTDCCDPRRGGDRSIVHVICTILPKHSVWIRGGLAGPARNWTSGWNVFRLPEQGGGALSASGAVFSGTRHRTSQRQLVHRHPVIGTGSFPFESGRGAIAWVDLMLRPVWPRRSDFLASRCLQSFAVSSGARGNSR